MISEKPKNRTERIEYSGVLLARNTIYNLFGQISPLIVAFIAIPFLIDAMGTDRFGVLTMAWMAVGYFSLFDMGIGRATTKFVAEYYAQGNQDKLPGLIKASLILITAFGVIAGGILAIITSWLVTDILNIPEYLINEALGSFYLLAASIPIAVLIAGARGVLESRQKFGIINAVRIPAGMASFLVPLMVLPFSNSLLPIIGMLVVSRVVALFFYLYFCFKNLYSTPKKSGMEKIFFKQLLGFGGWITVSNVIAPLLGGTDRFFIGAISTLTAVTYYATPLDMINKLFIIPVGIMGVIFPAFCAFSAEENDRLDNLHRRTINYIFASMFPIITCIIVFAKPLLNLWLGSEFASESAFVLQVLAAGALFSSVARVPFNAVQAMGRADLTAKLFLFELPIYIVLLVFATKTFGIIGTATLWTGRLVIELGVLAVLYRKTVKVEERKLNYMRLYVWLVGLTASSFLLSFIAGLYYKIIVFIVFIVIVGSLIYTFLLDDFDKTFLKRDLRKYFSRN